MILFCVCMCGFFLTRSRDSSALPVKRLWHFLVKQEVLQETFMRYIFTKKRKQSEVFWEKKISHNFHLVFFNISWRIPGMVEPGGLLSMGSHRVGHNWSDLAVPHACGSRTRLILFTNHSLTWMAIVVSSDQQSFIFSVDLKIMYLSEELEEWSIGILLYLISFFDNKRPQWYGNDWCRVLSREPHSWIHFLSFNLLFTAFSIVILSPNPVK